jgi:hypothetical protein
MQLNEVKTFLNLKKGLRKQINGTINDKNKS